MQNKFYSGFGLVGIIIALAVVVLVVGGGYFVYQRLAQKTTPAEINSFGDCSKAGYPVAESYPRQCYTPDGKNFIEEVKQEETPAVDTSNWKTYRGDQGGYQFKYPGNWRAQSNGNGGVILDSSLSSGFFEVAFDYSDLGIIESDGHVARVHDGVEVVHIESSRFMFAGISAIREIRQENYEYYISPTSNKPYSSPKIVTTIFFSSNIPDSKNLEDFKIQFSPSLDVFNQILSTFKFIK